MLKSLPENRQTKVQFFIITSEKSCNFLLIVILVTWSFSIFKVDNKSRISIKFSVVLKFIANLEPCDVRNKHNCNIHYAHLYGKAKVCDGQVVYAILENTYTR